MELQQRIALGIEYDGQPYQGWQRQDNGPSVQAAVEAALSKVADQAITVHCSGRTDTGVHALQQVVHFDTTAKRSERAWVLGSNSHLPSSIAVCWARPIDGDFHARFSAIARSYEYTMMNRWTRSALWANRATWVCQPLDVASMHRAAQVLVGEHDFTSFRTVACQAKHPRRHIYYIDVNIVDPGPTTIIKVRIKANGFLHHMVRNIVGSLIKVGKGEASESWLADVLEAKDRRVAGPTAPAQGLVFLQAHYPSIYELPLDS